MPRETWRAVVAGRRPVPARPRRRRRPHDDLSL